MSTYSRKVLKHALLAAIVANAAVLGYLGGRRNALVTTRLTLEAQRARIRMLETRLAQLAALPPGAPLPGFAGVDPDGLFHQIIYSPAARPRLFYYLSATCPSWNDNLPLFNRLHHAQGQWVEFFALSTNDREDTEQYLSLHPCSFPVLHSLTAEIWERYRLDHYPQVVLVNGAGEVVRSWSGMLTEATEIALSSRRAALRPQQVDR